MTDHLASRETEDPCPREASPPDAGGPVLGNLVRTAAQWRICATRRQADFILFPDFDESLRRSMRKETELSSTA